MSREELNPKESKDIFFRKRYILMIQYALEDKIIRMIKNKFQVEEKDTDKGTILIIEDKDDLLEREKD